ncbi:hypothetical protein HWV62_24536 [Athelia sp. TMB]|nr:hypothetical protein HWV62_24536 [Athelia sp. TMB]
MSNRDKASVESTCTVFSCTSNEFCDVYEDSTVSTSVLSEDTLASIAGNRELLRSAEQRYRLGDLLSGMLDYAPNPLGKRYVAVALHVASKKEGRHRGRSCKSTNGADVPPQSTSIRTNRSVSSLNPCLQHWLSQRPLFPNLNPAVARPLLQCSISKLPVCLDSLSAVSEREGTAYQIFPAKAARQVAKRELYYCAITHAFDKARARNLRKRGLKTDNPDVALSRMEVAHIMPPLLSNLGGKAPASVRFSIFLIYF